MDQNLPVELTSFNATVSNNNIKLSWQTATEIKNYGFEIEREKLTSNSTSGVWQKIGFVNGNGNSNSIKNYSFIDNGLSDGKYSYTLKQIDNDGNFEYSKKVEISVTQANKFNLDQNYPNPFNPSTKIKYSLQNASNVTLTVYDILGNKVQVLVKTQTRSRLP